MGKASLGLLASLLLLGLSACRGQTSEKPPIVPIRNMHDQPRYDPQELSRFFADKRTMRPPPEGTLARESESDLALTTGREQPGAHCAGGEGVKAADCDTKHGAWVKEVPEKVVSDKGGMAPLLTRGQERFNIYCSPCHANSGNGKGIIPQRAGSGAFQPPSLHIDRLRHIPDGQLFATISNGIRNMPAYRHVLSVEDRWAVVAYVRALQLSQKGSEQARGNTQEAKQP